MLEIKPMGLPEAAEEMFVNGKLAENGHVKVTFPYLHKGCNVVSDRQGAPKSST